MIDTRLIERYAAQAWPAAEAREEEGWLLRHTPGVPRRRSNSALPLARGQALLTALSRVEDFYAARGMPAAVQVAPAEEYTALDGLLAERGYRTDAVTLVCVAPTGTVITSSRPAVPLEVTIAEHPTRQWLDAYVALDDHENSQEAADQVLSRIPGPAAYLSAGRDDHQVVSIGLIVAAPGCGGVFCMTTHPAHRRQGTATAILHAGARWAAAHGAEELYLQVTGDNHAARRLYHHGRIPRLAHLPLPPQALRQSLPPRPQPRPPGRRTHKSAASSEGLARGRLRSAPAACTYRPVRFRVAR